MIIAINNPNAQLQNHQHTSTRRPGGLWRPRQVSKVWANGISYMCIHMYMYIYIYICICIHTSLSIYIYIRARGALALLVQ